MRKNMRFPFKVMEGLQGTPRPKEETQNGHQMEKRDLTKVPMIKKTLILTERHF